MRRVGEGRQREHALNLAKLVEQHRERTESYQQDVEQWQRDRLELSRRKQAEAEKACLSHDLQCSLCFLVCVCVCDVQCKAIAMCSSMLRSMMKDEE